jgi:hypothetical protein
VNKKRKLAASNTAYKVNDENVEGKWNAKWQAKKKVKSKK